MTPAPTNKQACVVDIRKDVGVIEEPIFVDTNVWFWFLSTIGYFSGKPYQVDVYPNFISSIFQSNQLYACVVNLIELSSIIEDACHKIYCREHGVELSKKQYRYTVVDERNKIVDEIKGIWENIKNFATIIDTEVSAHCDIDIILESITNTHVDAYDSLILHHMAKHGIQCIISDDFDFITAPNVHIYTANEKMVSKARHSGQLLL